MHALYSPLDPDIQSAKSWEGSDKDDSDDDDEYDKVGTSGFTASALARYLADSKPSTIIEARNTASPPPTPETND